MVCVRCALQEGTACEGGLNVFNSEVLGIVLSIETPLLDLFRLCFVVDDAISLPDVQGTAIGLIMRVSETTFPSLSQTFLHDAFEYLHFPGNFFYLEPEEVDLADLLPERILVRFSERA